jgi:hypothetical protein
MNELFFCNVPELTPSGFLRQRTRETRESDRRRFLAAGEDLQERAPRRVRPPAEAMAVATRPGPRCSAENKPDGRPRAWQRSPQPLCSPSVGTRGQFWSPRAMCPGLSKDHSACEKKLLLR